MTCRLVPQLAVCLDLRMAVPTKNGGPEAPFLAPPLVQAALRFDAIRMNVPEHEQIKANWGRYLVTKAAPDKGAFKTPTRRHGTQGTPSMPNGVFQSLEDILEFYDRGGGAIAGKSPRLRLLGLTAQDKRDLLAFLQPLTGELPPLTPAASPR